MGADVKKKKNATPSSKGRRERNCAAQKAYRQRQTLYIGELEEKLLSASKPENERCQQLEDSNRYYRHELLEAYKKLESTRISLESVLQSVAEAIGMQQNRTRRCNRCQDTTGNQAEPPLVSAVLDLSPTFESRGLPEGQEQQPPSIVLEHMFSCENPTLDVMHLDFGDSTASSSDDFMSAEDFGLQDEGHKEMEDLTLEQDALPAPAQQQPSLMDGRVLTGIHTRGETSASSIPVHLAYDSSLMGYKNFQHLTDLSPKILDANGHHLARQTNSPFSDHITFVEHLIGREWWKVAAMGGSERSPSLDNYVSFMLSTFTSVSWEAMRPFWVYTKAHRPVVNVTTWRLKPDADTYVKLAPWYRPTQIQLSMPHPIVIDWVPYPTMRDRLVLLHSCNPRLDEIICKIADSYVMEVDFSRLVSGAEPCTVYVRVLDLIAAISGADEPKLAPCEAEPATLAEQTCFGTATAVATASISTSTDIGSASYAQPEILPAPSIAAIFGSKALALQAFKLLGMDRSPGAMKLDPLFFEAHPELYDCRLNDIIARGIAIGPPRTTTAPVLTPLDLKTLTKYTEMAKWYIDVSVADDGGWGDAPH